MPTSSTLTGAPLTLALLLTLPLLSFLRLLFPAPSPILQSLNHITYDRPLHLIFALSLIYQMRTVERLWGTRKLGAFVLAVVPWCVVLCVGVERLLGGRGNVGAGIGVEGGVGAGGEAGLGQGVGTGTGPTVLLFGMLVQWCEAVPFVWKYANVSVLDSNTAQTGEGRGGSGEGNEDARDERTWAIEPSSKWQTYMVATQVALANWPSSAVLAVGGWAVGWAWRRGVLPGRGMVDGVFGI